MGSGHDTSTPCSVTSAFTTGGETVEGYALFGYTFENVSVTGQFSCWLECQQNCQCVSFNFLTNVKRDNCQLNKEDRFQRPGSMKALHGSQYYDLMTGYRVQVQVFLIFATFERNFKLRWALHMDRYYWYLEYTHDQRSFMGSILPERALWRFQPQLRYSVFCENIYTQRVSLSTQE